MSIISALAIPALVGFVALVAEMGHGLVTKVENQRIADAAAYAGALAYKVNNSTTAMTAAAQRAAALNGVASSGVVASLVTSPRTAGVSAVTVQLTTSNVLLLAPVVGFGTSMTVGATAFAEISGAATPCILALNGTGTGISLSGGTKLTASACTVASNASETVPCGTTMTAQSITYNGTTPSQPCTGITGNILKTAVSDPLSSNVGVLAATAHNATLSSLSAPTPPGALTGTDVGFGYLALTTQLQLLLAGCNGTLSGTTWTVTCSTGSSYALGNITVAGGLTVNFNLSGSASTTYAIARGIIVGGGAKLAFGPGTFRIGGVISLCNGISYYSICNTGTALTFSGPSTFQIAAGIYNAGGSSLALGSGSSNAIAIGAAADGNAINLGGGAITNFAATGSNTFQVVGNVVQGGGGCTTFGAGDQHDIRGSVSLAGGTLLGAGVYSATGYLVFGGNGGGDVTCGGTLVGVSGTGVTLVTAGQATWLGSSCNGAAFCIASGFSNVSLTAPSSGSYANLAVIGPLSTTYSGSAMFVEGASATTLAGAVYFPNGAMTLSGGASVGSLTGQCLMLIAPQIVLTGGTSVTGSNCFATTTANATPVLVQ